METINHGQQAEEEMEEKMMLLKGARSMGKKAKEGNRERVSGFQSGSDQDLAWLEGYDGSLKK